MIINALREICKISDDEDINFRNYIDGLNYVDNLYFILNKLKQITYVHELDFLPSFKGRYICEELGISAYPEENEMKVFKIKSDLFLGDKKFIDAVTDLFNDLCSKMTYIDGVYTLVLK